MTATAEQQAAAGQASATATATHLETSAAAEVVAAKNYLLSELLPNLPASEADYVKGCIKSGIDTPEKLIKRTAELHKEISERRKLPTDKSTQEEWNEFMGHLGAQKDPAAYGLPAEAEGDAKSYLQGLQNAAAEAGVPKRIWDKFANSFTGLHKKVEEQRASDLASGREKLKDVLIGKYGAKAESVLQRAEKRLGEIFGGDATIAERMRAAGLSNELAFVEGLISVDRVLSDDTLPQNRVAINSSAPTDLLDAAKKAKSIGQSPALHNFRHKDHAAANKEFEDCMRVVAAAGHKTPAAAIAAANKSRK